MSSEKGSMEGVPPIYRDDIGWNAGLQKKGDALYKGIDRSEIPLEEGREQLVTLIDEIQAVIVASGKAPIHEPIQWHSRFFQDALAALYQLQTKIRASKKSE